MAVASATFAATGNKPNGNKANFWRGDYNNVFNNTTKGNPSTIRPNVTVMQNWDDVSHVGGDYNKVGKKLKEGTIPGGNRIVDVSALYRAPSLSVIRLGVDRERGWEAGHVEFPARYSMYGSIGIGQMKNDYFPFVLHCTDATTGLIIKGGKYDSKTNVVEVVGTGNIYVSAYGGYHSDESDGRLRINGGTHIVDNIFIGSSDKNAAQNHIGYVVVTNGIMNGNNDGAGPITVNQTIATVVKTRQSVGLYNGELLVGSSTLEIRTETASGKGLYLGSDGAPHDVAMKVENGTLTNHGETTIGAKYAARDNGSYTATLDISGNSKATFESNIYIANGVGSAADTATLNVSGGEVTAKSTIWLGNRGNGRLIVKNAKIDNSASEITIGRFGSKDTIRKAELQVLAGGELQTQKIAFAIGESQATVLIDGGVLKATSETDVFIAKLEQTHIDNGSSFDVKVGAGGGTIDTAGADIKVQQPVQSGVESGKDGGMAFAGGGSVELASAGWNGGTTLKEGTELKFDTLASAKTLLAGGVKIVAPEVMTAVVSLPDNSAETFEKTDLANISIVDGTGKDLSDEYKAAVVSGGKAIKIVDKHAVSLFVK